MDGATTALSDLLSGWRPADGGKRRTQAPDSRSYVGTVTGLRTTSSDRMDQRAASITAPRRRQVAHPTTQPRGQRSLVQVSRQAAGRSRGSLATQPRSAASISAACVVPERPASGSTASPAQSRDHVGAPAAPGCSETPWPATAPPAALPPPSVGIAGGAAPAAATDRR